LRNSNRVFNLVEFSHFIYERYEAGFDLHATRQTSGALDEI